MLWAVNILPLQVLLNHSAIPMKPKDQPYAAFTNGLKVLSPAQAVVFGERTHHQQQFERSLEILPPVLLFKPNVYHP